MHRIAFSAAAILSSSFLAAAHPAGAATTYSCASAHSDTTKCAQGNGARVLTTDAYSNVTPEGASARSTASSQAGIGTLKVMASAASDTIPDTRNFASASSWATAQWNDNITVNGGTKGTSGFLTGKLGFNGSTVGAVAGVTSKGNVGSVNLGYDLSGIGFNAINYSKGFSNDGDFDDLVTLSNSIDQLVDVRIAFIFGYSTGISVFLSTGVQTGVYTHWNEEGAMSAGATSDFSHSLLWGGITGVFDRFGTPIPAYSATGDTGFDYTQSLIPGVPEPATWAMLIAGFGLVGIRARRRTVAPILQRPDTGQIRFA